MDVFARFQPAQHGHRWLLAAATLLLALPAQGRVETHIARAYSLETGELLYTERHQERWSDGRLESCKVLYGAPDGEIFARKELSFAASPTAPSFEMVDFRQGYLEGASRSSESVELFSREGFAAETRVKNIEAPAAAVIDAGFHRLVQRHLGQLIRGEKIAFPFAVPAEGRFVRFQLEKTGEGVYRGEPTVTLRMRASNPILRLLVGPIELIYDRGGRLLEYIGLSNVRNEVGELRRARIVFEYGEERLAAAARGDEAGAGRGR